MITEMKSMEKLPLLDLQPGFSKKKTVPAFAFARDFAREYTIVNAAPLPPEPFHLLQGEGAAPKSSHEEAMRCVGTDDDQYTKNDGALDALLRVLFYNPPMGSEKDRERISASRMKYSYLGPNGHLERANAWIHLVGALLFLVFATIRPLFLNTISTAGILSSITSAVVMLTFFVSTAYHSLGTLNGLMPLLRTLDHSSIYIALALATVTDTAVVTMDFKDVPWQTIFDVVVVAVLLLAFFSYRRIVLPASQTVIAWGSCKTGLFRLSHADNEHSALRSSGYVILSFGFISLIPTAIQNLSYDMAVVLLICNGASLIMLIAGLLLDNALVWPDKMYQNGKTPSCTCHSKRAGCICNSHAIWHLLSLVSVIVLTSGREVVILFTLEDRYGGKNW